MSVVMRPRVWGVGLLTGLLAAAAALLAAPPAAAQTDTAYGFEQLLMIQDSDATVPPDTEDVELDVVLRFTTEEVLTASQITVVAAETTVGRVRGSRGVDVDPDTRPTGACTQSPDDELIWDCVLGTYVADVFGLAEGEYTLSVRDTVYKLTVDGTDYDGTADAATALLTIGQVVEVASVTLGLAEDEPTVRAANSTGIDLVLSVINANNAAADPDAILSILVNAQLLSLSSSAPGASCSASICQWTSASVQQLNRGGLAAIALTVNSTQPASGEVTVTLVTSTGGTFEAKSPMLMFSGAASRFTLAEPSGSLLNVEANDNRDEIQIEVTAEDNAGNAAEVPARLSLSVQDPDGQVVAASAISRRQLAPDAADRVYIKLQTLADDASALAVGEYRLRVSRSGVSAERSFRVAGKTAAVDLSVSPPIWSSSVASVVATAVLTDANGQPVADGTPVSFTATPVGTVGAGGAQLIMASGSGALKTSGGSASTRFLVVGSGSAYITASADDQTGVQVVQVAAAPPPPEQPVGLDGLNQRALNNFSSWISQRGSSASELFAELKLRGASALMKWDPNTRTWARYAERGEARVPGSTDFTIELGDVLWLGG